MGSGESGEWYGNGESSFESMDIGVGSPDVSRPPMRQLLFSPVSPWTKSSMIQLLFLLLHLPSVYGGDREDAEWHRRVTQEALEAAARELVLADPGCVRALAGFQGRPEPDPSTTWPLAQLALVCEFTTEWANIEEAMGAIAWASAAASFTSHPARVMSVWPNGSPDPGVFRARLIRLRSLAWKLIERGDYGAARQKLGHYLHAIQSLARLRIRDGDATIGILREFAPEEMNSLALDIIQNPPTTGSSEDALARDESELAHAISVRSLLDIGATVKETWDTNLNYSSALRDSRLLAALGLWQRPIGLIVDTPCGGQASAGPGLETLLGSVVEKGFFGLCRSRFWVMRSRGSSIQLATVSLAAYRCDRDLDHGLTWLSAQLSAFLRQVCEGTEPQSARFPSEHGLLTILNSVGVGGRVFVLSDSDQGILGQGEALTTFKLLAAARQLRVDVFLAGTQAANVPMIDDSIAAPFFRLAKQRGGLYVPLHSEQPLTVDLLKAIGGTLNDRRVIYDGRLQGQLSRRVEERGTVQLLAHCTAAVQFKLDETLLPASRFLAQELAADFHISVLEPRGATCYAQIFYTEGGAPTPAIQLLSEDGAPLGLRSLPSQGLCLALSWPRPPSHCRLSWTQEDGTELSPEEDCERYKITSTPAKGGLLQIQATMAGMPTPIFRILPFYFSPGSEEPSTLTFSPQDATVGGTTGAPLGADDIDPVLGVPFGRSIASIKLQLPQGSASSSALIVGNCVVNSSILVRASRLQPDDQRFSVPLAVEECSTPNIAQLICLSVSKQKEGVVLLPAKKAASWRCVWLPHSAPVPPPASLPSLSQAEATSSIQKPSDICTSGFLGWSRCDRWKWYLEFAINGIDRVHYQTWPPNATTALTDILIRPQQRRLKVEGNCCIRNLTLRGVGLGTGLGARMSFTVDPWFNWFPGPDAWTLWKIAFVIAVILLGLFIVLFVLVSLVRWVRRRRARRRAPPPPRRQNSFHMSQPLNMASEEGKLQEPERTHPLHFLHSSV